MLQIDRIHPRQIFVRVGIPVKILNAIVGYDDIRIRYHGPDPGKRLPGYNLTKTELKAYGKDIRTGSAATPAAQRAQGGTLSEFSRATKKMWGLK